MTEHDLYDVALWVGIGCALASSVISALRTRYWQRIARAHENARIDANETAGVWKHSHRQLERAVALIERRRPANDTTD